MLPYFLNFLSNRILLATDARILLAVSGGIDSVVMTELFSKAGYPFAIAHMNFNLRGEESLRDEDFVKNLAAKYKVQLFIKRVDTIEFARKNKLSVQVAARDLRYQWFEELRIKHGFDGVATAHHLDDQVETFLINLARGTGISGLHGIPVKNGHIIRPMLFASRQEIVDYSRENDLPFVEDSSNIYDKYTRNRIRHHVIPQLEKINPSFREGLNDTILNIRDAEIIYKHAIEMARNSIVIVRENQAIIKLVDLLNLNPLNTYAYELLSPYGFNISQVDQIIALKDSIPGKEIISPSHRLVRDREELIIVPRHDIPGKSEFEVNYGDLEPGISQPLRLSFEIREDLIADKKTSPDEALLDLVKLVFPLIIRKWKRGDAFVPFGMSKPKKLSDFFIDLKYSRIEKEQQWLLCSGNEIVWVIGRRIDDRYKVSDQTGNVLRIRVHPS